jgi:long-chain acyl-CoA synthetase
MVVGDRRSYLVALIGVEADTVSDWVARQGLPFTTYADLSRKPEVVELIAHWVDEVNRDLARPETIKRFALIEKELDHEDGELTATLKVKRRALEERFQREIEELYV